VQTVRLVPELGLILDPFVWIQQVRGDQPPECGGLLLHHRQHIPEAGGVCSSLDCFGSFLSDLAILSS
jgi:hypothetical protein